MRRGSFFLAAGNRVFSALPSREVSRGRSFGADKDHRKRRRVDGREAVLDHSGRGPLSAPSFQVTLVVKRIGFHCLKQKRKVSAVPYFKQN